MFLTSHTIEYTSFEQFDWNYSKNMFSEEGYVFISLTSCCVNFVILCSSQRSSDLTNCNSNICGKGPLYFPENATEEFSEVTWPSDALLTIRVNDHFIFYEIILYNSWLLSNGLQVFPNNNLRLKSCGLNFFSSLSTRFGCVRIPMVLGMARLISRLIQLLCDCTLLDLFHLNEILALTVQVYSFVEKVSEDVTASIRGFACQDFEI